MSTRAQPDLRLFTSNRLEILVEHLAGCLQTPLSSPMVEEVVVVRNQGMERWLRLELARRLGVCAGFKFQFPEEFIRQMLQRVLPDLPAEDPLQRDLLAWRIAAALPKLQDQPAFKPVRHYLEDGDERKLLQLAGRLAHLLDQYQVFRPGLVLGWDNHQDGSDPASAWQAELWRTVTGHAPGLHPAALAARFKSGLPGAPAERLPERVTVFGVSALPPFHLGMLAELAKRVPVSLFLLQPCQEYWGQITSPREEDRILRRMAKQDAKPFEFHLDPGHRLLASLGYLGRDFLNLLLDAGEWQSTECFEEPGGDTLLHALQSDVLHLHDRGADRRRTPVKADDTSIRIHCCHSPLREMEVLQDHILHWLQADPTLQPRDIVVMMPDIEAYAPFVQAVFGAPEDDKRRIPFSLADRETRRSSQVAASFLALLALPETRLAAGPVLALLDTAAVRERFDLTEQDVEVLRDWVRELNIRWGADAPHRATLGLPGLEANTWRQGVDRLLLGHAMAGHGRNLAHGILPFDDVEGDRAELAGKLAEYLERLFRFVEQFQERRSLADWASLLEGVVTNFYAASEASTRECQILRETLADLRQQAAQSGYTAPLGLAALRERLEPALAEDLQQAGFLKGDVTFCGLKPMRSIPFRVVCLVGMNDGAFPRPAPHLGFDLMARKPQLGDRSTREDDRYLFLETLLAARERLHISYVGLSVKDNRESPPSVLVSELLDALAQGFEPAVKPPDPASRNALRDQLVVRHRLQAFHPDYFNGSKPGLFSFSTTNCGASRAAGQASAAPRVFLPNPLPPPAAAARVLSLEDLARFLTKPAASFLRRLQVWFPETAEALEERESFVLDPLGESRVRQAVLKADPADPMQQIFAAAGELPPGKVGQLGFIKAQAEAEAFRSLVAARRRTPPRAPLDVELTLGAFTLTGRIAEFTARGPLFFHPSKFKAHRCLQAWVHHLAANCVEPGQATTLLATDKAVLFQPPEKPKPLLESLLELYWQGLCEPLPFFPESALAYANQVHPWPQAGGPIPDEDRRNGLKAARKKWEGDPFDKTLPECEVLAFDCCFHQVDPLDARFEELARAILGPLLDHQTKDKP